MRVGCKALLILSLLGLAPASAQSPQYVQQSGVVTNSHIATWTYSGIIQDSGVAINAISGPLWLSNAMDLQFGSTPGDLICRSTLSWVALPSGSAGQYLTAQANACPSWTSTAPALGALRLVSSGTTDIATTSDYTVAWDSASSGAKSQTIYTCNSSVKARVLNLKDEVGNAGTYNITITPTSGTIEGQASYLLGFNLQAVTLVCDGVSNWFVL